MKSTLKKKIGMSITETKKKHTHTALPLVHTSDDANQLNLWIKLNSSVEWKKKKVQRKKWMRRRAHNKGQEKKKWK